MKKGRNLSDIHPADKFVCSECGIVLEEWVRVEYDPDNDDTTNYEYVFKFCPNCGINVEE